MSDQNFHFGGRIFEYYQVKHQFFLVPLAGAEYTYRVNGLIGQLKSIGYGSMTESERRATINSGIFYFDGHEWVFNFSNGLYEKGKMSSKENGIVEDGLFARTDFDVQIISGLPSIVGDVGGAVLDHSARHSPASITVSTPARHSTQQKSTSNGSNKHITKNSYTIAEVPSSSGETYEHHYQTKQTTHTRDHEETGKHNPGINFKVNAAPPHLVRFYF